MLYYPQLSTGTSGQYPLGRERSARVVRRTARDGSARSYLDSPAERVGWRLNYQGLTDAEREALEELFVACEGRLKSFLLLDPAANLLAWSEDFTQSTWTRDPLLTAMPGLDDPWGETRATLLRNVSGVAQELSQSIPGCGLFTYCLSGYVLAPGILVTLGIASGASRVERTVRMGTGWERIWVAGQPGMDAGTVLFSLAFEGGAEAAVVGLQAEAQPAPGGYRRTASRGGVYPEARFSTDALTWTRRGPNDNVVQIRMESRP